MYEGREKRYPTPTQRREVWRRDRHCVFPGCSNVLFTNCHHIVEWKSGVPTDLSTWRCSVTTIMIHQKIWSMTGDANVELCFVGPTGQVMTTRPSRLWAQVSDPKVMAERRQKLQEAKPGRGEKTPGSDGDDSEGGGGRDRGG